jgi:hypothetical protein
MSARNGKPCIRCGSNEWKKNGDCLPCANARHKRWRNTNPERVKENNRKYHQNNREKESERNRQWRQTHQEQERDNRRRWQQNNPDKVKEANQRWRKNNLERDNEHRRQYRQNNPEGVIARANRRRTRKSAAGGSYTPAEWKALVTHFGNKCLCCGRNDVKLTADHVIPVVKGGTSSIDNIQPLCLKCNQSKGGKTIDYRPGKGLGRWVQKKLFG